MTARLRLRSSLWAASGCIALVWFSIVHPPAFWRETWPWIALGLLQSALPLRLRSGGSLPLTLAAAAAVLPRDPGAALWIGALGPLLAGLAYRGGAWPWLEDTGIAWLSLSAGFGSATLARTGSTLPPPAVAALGAFAALSYWSVLTMAADWLKEPARRPDLWYGRGLAIAGPLTAAGLSGALFATAAPSLGPLLTAALAAVLHMAVVNRHNALIAVAQAHRKTVDALSTLTSGDDPFVTGHPYRVARYAVAAGRRLRMSKGELDVLEYAALLHNLGALDSQWELGNRPGKLSADEIERVHRAMAAGADVVARFGYYPRAAVLIRRHLQRFDQGGADAPLGARVLAIANALDAMLVRNRWRRSLSLEETLAELQAGAGNQFDPAIVQAMIETVRGDPEIASLVDNPYQAPPDRTMLLGRRPPRISPAAQAALTVQNTQLHSRVEEVLRLLAATKSHTELILDSLPDAVFTTDAKGYITFVNRAAAEMTGSSAREAAGRRFHDVFGEFAGMSDEVDTLRRLLAEPLSGSHAGFQAEVRLGSEPAAIPARLHLGVLADRGEAVGGVGVVDDLRHWKQLEAQVKRAERLAMLGELAASVAHEVRNPLAIIRGYAECLPQDVESPEALQESVDTILREVDRLNRVIASVLAFARPARIEAREIDLNAELRRVLEPLRPQAEAQRVTIEFAPGPLPPVMADVEMLEQVFLNLAINALQAMPDGGRLHCATAALPDGRVSVRFVDTGTGIAPELQDKIFQPFFTTKRKGTGLGLAISARIVEEHGGRIQAAPAEGGGTVFTLELPVRADPRAVA